MHHISFRLPIITAAALALLVVFTFAQSEADADKAYHSERLELAPVGAEEEGSGQVVNIHPNGPVNGALERYALRRATPSTEYDVVIQTCDGGGTYSDFTTTSTLVTNKHGNGHAQGAFSAEDLLPFAGAVIDIRWVLKDGGTIAYATECTTVTIDDASIWLD